MKLTAIPPAAMFHWQGVALGLAIFCILLAWKHGRHVWPLSSVHVPDLPDMANVDVDVPDVEMGCETSVQAKLVVEAVDLGAEASKPNLENPIGFWIPEPELIGAHVWPKFQAQQVQVTTDQVVQNDQNDQTNTLEAFGELAAQIEDAIADLGKQLGHEMEKLCARPHEPDQAMDSADFWLVTEPCQGKADPRRRSVNAFAAELMEVAGLDPSPCTAHAVRWEIGDLVQPHEPWQLALTPRDLSGPPRPHVPVTENPRRRSCPVDSGHVTRLSNIFEYHQECRR